MLFDRLLYGFWFISGRCIQGRRKIDNWGGGGHIFIYSCYAQLISFEIEIKILKSIVFTVCEQEYMNICPPIIDLPACLAALPFVLYFWLLRYRLFIDSLYFQLLPRRRRLFYIFGYFATVCLSTVYISNYFLARDFCQQT